MRGSLARQSSGVSSERKPRRPIFSPTMGTPCGATIRAVRSVEPSPPKTRARSRYATWSRIRGSFHVDASQAEMPSFPTKSVISPATRWVSGILGWCKTPILAIFTFDCCVRSAIPPASPTVYVLVYLASCRASSPVGPRFHLDPG